MAEQKYGEILKLLRSQQKIRAESMADSLYMSLEEYLDVEKGEAVLSSLQLMIAGNILGCDIYPLRAGEAVMMTGEEHERITNKAAILQDLLKELADVSAEMAFDPDKVAENEKSGIDMETMPGEEDPFSIEENEAEAFAEPDSETLQYEDERFQEYVSMKIQNDEKQAAVYYEKE